MKNFNSILFIALFWVIFSNCKDRKPIKATNDKPSIDLQSTNKQDMDWEFPFDGKTLDGWKKLGGDATYHIEGDMIVGTTAAVSDTTNSFLATKKFYDNFILEFEVILDLAPDNYHNSGVQIRSNSLPEYRNGLVHGYQVEIDPDTTERSGGIYDEGRRGWVHDLSDNPVAKKAYKLGEWNYFRVVANGSSIKTWLNGVPAANYEDSMTSTGFIALQVHSTDSEKPLQVKWRNIKIKAL